MVLMIDNYDSFTWNLVQYFRQLGEEVAVYRNDEITVEEAEALEFDYLVISPGPGRPAEAGVSRQMIRRFAGQKPILGVCLGHQAIAEEFGGKIVQAGAIMHGKADLVEHDGRSLYAGVPNPLRVIRYHSLAVDRTAVPEEFEVSAVSPDGEVMGLRHREYRIEGVQFHPESIGSENGIRLLANFLSGVREVQPVRTLLQRLADGGSLSEEEAGHLMDLLSAGELSAAQAGALLTAVTVKGPTVDELCGFVRVLREKAVHVPLPPGRVCIDTCGTGGDRSGSFNISTAAALTAAGAGVTVAKHGNRSITSKSGSADVLEELGVNVNMDPFSATNALEQAGFCFLFAPHFHPAFKHIMGARRELGFRTFFNMMGPMLNPAGVQSQVMGVFDPALQEPAARVLGRLGAKHVLTVHGHGGVDEFSMTGPTRVVEFKNGWLREWQFDPRDFGFSLCRLEDLKGGDARQNADIITRVFSGERGPHRDVVLVNAAAAILVGGQADDFSEALELARASIDSGAARYRLELLRKLSAAENG